MTLAEIKGRLRAGPYAWPGGYPIFFVMVDGGVLSFKAVRAEWRQIVQAHLNPIDNHAQWRIAGCEINWEDSELYCDHTGERIESAYGED